MTPTRPDYRSKRFDVRMTPNLPYGRGGIHHTQPDAQPRERTLCLDLYEGIGSETPGGRPALVLAFGGAFHRGSKETDAVLEDGRQNTPVAEYCREFAKRGYVCFAIDYRLTPEDPDPGRTPLLLNPLNVNRDRIDIVRGIMGLPPSTPTMIANAMEAAFDDMAAALRWVHAHAPELGVDPARIAAGGFSAGAIMAMAATYGEALPVAAVVSLSGAMGTAEMKKYLGHGVQPPVILFHGENDLASIRYQTGEMKTQMRAAGLEHHTHCIAGGTHFYPRSAALSLADGRASTVEETLCEFLHERLVGPGAAD